LRVKRNIYKIKSSDHKLIIFKLFLQSLVIINDGNVIIISLILENQLIYHLIIVTKKDFSVIGELVKWN
jgi:hypothetical protein